MLGWGLGVGICYFLFVSPHAGSVWGLAVPVQQRSTHSAASQTEFACEVMCPLFSLPPCANGTDSWVEDEIWLFQSVRAVLMMLPPKLGWIACSLMCLVFSTPLTPPPVPKWCWLKGKGWGLIVAVHQWYVMAQLPRLYSYFFKCKNIKLQNYKQHEEREGNGSKEWQLISKCLA